MFTRYTDVAQFKLDSVFVEKRKAGFFGRETDIILIVNGIRFEAIHYMDAEQLYKAFLEGKVISCEKQFDGNGADEASETMEYTIQNHRGWVVILKK